MVTMNVTEKEFNELKASVKRIETALLGDKDMKIDGMAHKIDKHDKYIEKAKTRHAWTTGIAAGIGFVLHQITEWLKH